MQYNIDHRQSAGRQVVRETNEEATEYVGRDCRRRAGLHRRLGLSEICGEAGQDGLAEVLCHGGFRWPLHR